VAQFLVGTLFRSGSGVPSSDAEAVEWYRKSAAQGYGPAQHNLAYMLEHGLGTAVDLGQAATLYQQAASQGLTIALVNLAGMHEHGRGMPRNPVLAADLLRRALQDPAGLTEAEAANARQRLASLAVVLPQPLPSAAESADPVVVATIAIKPPPVLEMTPLAPAAASAADPSCPSIAGVTGQDFRVRNPRKEGDYVYVEAKGRVYLCVVDASANATGRWLEPGMNTTVRGLAPFQVSLGNHRDARLFYQGRPVKVEGAAPQVIRLVPNVRAQPVPAQEARQ
jgi:hypothetical protein